ncbi:MAG: hypothetical protein ACLP5V_04460 [Candidatus Bathyarchaeia archaeon]
MSARTVTGVVMSILGLLLLLYSGYEFNNLFFIDRLLHVSDIPAYNGFVVMPFLLGNLALLDGAIALGLKRSFSVSIHLLGNVLWLYALYILYDNLAIPITNITAYHQAFLLGFLGLIFFVIGVIANDIPKRKIT